MKFLKGLALFLLSSLLLLSLSIFGLLFTVNNTVLNPGFVVSQIDRLDISSLTEVFLSEQRFQAEELMAEVLPDIIADLEPWIKEQASASIYSGYDYFLGKSESLSLTISMEPVKEALRKALLASLPPELAGLPPAEIEQYFDQFFQNFTGDLPSTFEFDVNSLNPEVLAQLQQARQYVGYFRLAYNLLIVFILLIIGLIVLIHRRVKGATRNIGTIFLTYGVPWYVGTFVLKHFAGTMMPQLGDIPAWLQTWLTQLSGDFIAPLGALSLGLLIAGVALVVVSSVYKSWQPQFWKSHT